MPNFHISFDVYEAQVKEMLQWPRASFEYLVLYPMPDRRSENPAYNCLAIVTADDETSAWESIRRIFPLCSKRYLTPNTEANLRGYADFASMKEVRTVLAIPPARQ